MMKRDVHLHAQRIRLVEMHTARNEGIIPISLSALFLIVVVKTKTRPVMLFRGKCHSASKNTTSA